MLRIHNTESGSQQHNHENQSKAFQNFYGVTHSLFQIQKLLNELYSIKDMPYNEQTDEVRKWMSVVDDIVARPISMMLLMERSDQFANRKETIVNIAELSNDLENFVVYCINAGKICDLKNHVKEVYNGEFFRCFTYDLMEGHPGPPSESNTQVSHVLQKYL